MVSQGEKSIWVKRSNPSIHLIGSDGLNQWGLNAALTIERSSDKNLSQNREDPSISLEWKRELENGAFNIAAKYDEGSTRISELNTTGRVLSDGTRKSKAIEAGYKRLLTNRATVQLSSEYTELNYSGGNTSDSVSALARARVSYELNERTTPFIEAAIARYEPDGVTTDETLLSASTGFIQALSDKLSWTASAGLTHTAGAHDRTGFQGGVGINYIIEKSSFEASLARSMSTSGISGFVESDEIKARFSHRLSDQNQVGGDASLKKNRSGDAGESKNLGIWFNRELTAAWNFKTQLQVRQTETNGPVSTGEIASFTLTYTGEHF